MSWTWFSDTYPKARKNYRCFLCGWRIPVGEQHVARRGTDEEGPTTSRMHNECCDQTEDWKYDDWESCGIGEMEPPERIREMFAVANAKSTL